MRPRPSLICAFAVAVLIAAGCGGDDSDSGGDSGGGGGGANAVEVDMKGVKYVPADVTVPVGGTVHWTNSDTPAHTVTKQGGPGEEFDSGTLQPGDDFEQRFSEPGKVSYFCEIHPFQKGTVTVR